jgi:putative ABC transport system substrate-binding protein
LIVAAITKIHLPAIYGGTDDTVAGGLISYGPNWSDGFRSAAGYVARILKGTRPADMPFEQPTKFDPVINMKTARALGLTIPQSLLLGADEVIQ